MESSPHQIILGNDDVLLRTMEFLGPRHVSIGIGATCKDLRRLSHCNALWRVFWEARCMFSPPQEQSEKKRRETTTADDDGRSNRHDDDDADDANGGVHMAAFVFRHAIREMGLEDKMYNSNIIRPEERNENEQSTTMGEQESQSESPAPEDESILYHAYIQKHSMMKLTNLRVPLSFIQIHQLNNNNNNNNCSSSEQLGQCELKPPLCTQTWPRQLSLSTAATINNLSNRGADPRLRVTCENSAEAWCDHPSCKEARCGPQGCLRCYRFLPRDYSFSAGGQLSRECSERDYDLVSFVKCSWCSVSFCNQHVGRHCHQRKLWYKCDECQLSSCPDCVGQVFVSPPNTDGCSVETAGKICKRKICSKCIWHVGKEKRSMHRNVPGGDYANIGEPDDILTVKGEDVIDGKSIQWDEVETCCSKCLRHVEFRWKELAQVQESFGGFMP